MEWTCLCPKSTGSLPSHQEERREMLINASKSSPCKHLPGVSDQLWDTLCEIVSPCRVSLPPRTAVHKKSVFVPASKSRVFLCPGLLIRCKRERLLYPLSELPPGSCPLDYSWALNSQIPEPWKCKAPIPGDSVTLDAQAQVPSAGDEPMMGSITWQTSTQQGTQHSSTGLSSWDPKLPEMANCPRWLFAGLQKNLPSLRGYLNNYTLPSGLLS